MLLMLDMQKTRQLLMLLTLPRVIYPLLVVPNPPSLFAHSETQPRELERSNNDGLKISSTILVDHWMVNPGRMLEHKTGISFYGAL